MLPIRVILFSERFISSFPVIPMACPDMQRIPAAHPQPPGASRNAAGIAEPFSADSAGVLRDLSGKGGLAAAGMSEKVKLLLKKG